MTKEIRGYSGILIKTIQVPDSRSNMTVSEAARVLAGHRKAAIATKQEDANRVKAISILFAVTFTVTLILSIYGKIYS